MSVRPGIESDFLEDRGQAAVDFLAGMAVFLITVGFVLGAVPGMLQPFESETGANMVAAERSAATLVEDLLVERVDAPGVLNETCTATFFDANGDTADCRFTADASSMNRALGLSDSATANVTITSGGSVLSVDGPGGPVPAAAGPSPPPTADVVVSNRLALVDGTRGTVAVRVW